MVDTSANPPRTLREIAADITANWPQPHFAAKPYLDAMKRLDKVTDTYGADDGDDIVRRFLVNADRWHGAHARRIKAELRVLLR